MLNKIIPLLNKYIPTALAYKGIQKISPKLKDFATSAIASGYTIDNVIDYLRSRVSGERNEDFGTRPEEQASKAQVENSKQLPKALQAGAALAGGAIGGMASLGMDQAENIETMEESPKQQALKKFKQHQTKKPKMLDELYDQYQKGYGSKTNLQSQEMSDPTQSNQQPGQGQQALMSILQKIQQLRGG